MEIDVVFTNILVYLLVWTRLAGMLLFNPILSRNNVPARVRMGLVLFMALLLTPMQTTEAMAAVYQLSGFMYVFAAVRELAIGLVFGYVFQIFYYLLFFVGDMIDTDIGLSMAKTFDPASNIQVGFTSTIVTLLFTLYFFATGSHLTMLYMFGDTFTAIPVGTVSLQGGIITFVLRLFTRVFSLALRLIAPFMVAEFILQASMGILMRFIPQITVFVINFQLRIGLGLLMLYAFAPYIGQFIDTYIDTLFDSLFEASRLMAGG